MDSQKLDQEIFNLTEEFPFGSQAIDPFTFYGSLFWAYPSY
ncbi:MAG: hypothetical protein ACOC35_03830 [Promethearchaeia archaeon]